MMKSDANLFCCLRTIMLCLFLPLSWGEDMPAARATEPRNSDELCSRAGHVFRDIPYLQSSSQTVGDLYFPDDVHSRSPVALTIHGGEWTYMDKESFVGVAEYLCEQGYVVYNINFRQLSEGPWPLCGDDCMAALHFLCSSNNPLLVGLEQSQIVIVGGSSGGHLALMTGLRTKDRVDKVVCISGIADVAMDYAYCPNRYNKFFVTCPDSKVLEDVSPTGHLNENHPSILCTHAEGDDVVHAAESQSFVKQYNAAGGKAELYLYPRSNDGHCMWRPESIPRRLYQDIEDSISGFLAE